MKKKIRIFCLVLLIVISNLLACANKVPTKLIYNKEQAIILFLSKKKSIEGACKKEIWSTLYNIEGEEYSFKEIFIEDMSNFILNLDILNIMANKKKIQLDLKEKEQLEKISEEYYNKLKESKIDFLENVKLEDIKALFINYRLALKMREELLKSSGCEISENEARVILVDRIICSSKEDASDIKEALSRGDKNITKDCSIEHEIKIKKGELPQNIEKEIFNINNNEYSDIIEYKSKYYIFKVLKAYDEIETKKNKNELLNKKSLNILSELCDKFKKDKNITLNKEILKCIKKESDKNPDIVSFFDFYEENFDACN